MISGIIHQSPQSRYNTNRISFPLNNLNRFTVFIGQYHDVKRRILQSELGFGFNSYPSETLNLGSDDLILGDFCSRDIRANFDMLG
ncbi:hypothetical protein L1987_13225 [Smallanthus sonchifolius]|uniref:Uncharacterized protein n=1 Tax=Smallanthus sonchifolius TaxID=185202 RepID=A0ACB9JGS7_9ASTR|nr:hypothetical protein L1987_13225 [Smallanthus sonchifolius]